MIKYRTNQSELPTGAQTFIGKTQLYKWNELKQCLEEAGEQDDREFVQSSADCELHSVLERFGYYPQELLTPDNPQAVFSEGMFPTSRANVCAKADTCVTELANSLGTNREDLIKQTNGNLGSLLDKIEEYLKNVNKEVQNNGYAETQRQEDIPQHSNPDTQTQSEN